jgi:hypothetical protein
MRKAIKIGIARFPAMFPKLRSSRIYINADAIQILRLAAVILRSPNREMAFFDGVGNFTASWSTHPHLQFFLQDTSTMERWAVPPDEVRPIPNGYVSMLDRTSPVLHRAWRADPQGAYAQFVRQLFNSVHASLVPEVYKNVSPDMMEFWTLVDGCLSLYQASKRRPS